MPIDIDVLTSKDDADHARLAAACSHGMIYGTPEYRDFLLAAGLGEARYLGARRNGEMVGRIPLFVSPTTDVGRVANSLPWFGTQGGCVLAGPEPDATRDALLAALARHVREQEILSATVILPLFEHDQQPRYETLLAPKVVDPRIGQVTPLPGPGDHAALMKSFRYPAQVRKSLAQGFELVRTDEDWAWAFLHAVHVENMQAVNGKAKPWEHFVALRQALPPAWRSVSVAMLDGAPVAALLLLHFNETVEYFTPVIKHEFRPMQPMSFLIWNGMIEAMDRGFRRWNWGGTWITQKSLHHFKSGWGARDVPYAYLTMATDAGVETLRASRDRLGELFPYYFCYPFDAL